MRRRAQTYEEKASCFKNKDRQRHHELWTLSGRQANVSQHEAIILYDTCVCCGDNQYTWERLEEDCRMLSLHCVTVV